MSNMKTIIVADDLTGANVSNSLLAKHGLKVGSINDTNQVSLYKDYDALGLHTDSRGLDEKAAYRLVNEQVLKINSEGHMFFNKRIDSTLRGNIGAEIDGMLDALSPDTVAMVVPSYPDSGKIVIGNYMLVHGVPLEETDVRNDPTSPVTSSRVASIIREQSNDSIGVISMETILQGADAIKATISVLVDNGSRIIIFDSCTNSDIANIADAVLASKQPFISVDPGPFTSLIVKKTDSITSFKSKQKLLFLIGSASLISIAQMTQLRVDFNPFIVKVAVKKLLKEETREEEIQRVSTLLLANLESNRLLVMTTMLEEKDKINLDEEAKKLNLSITKASDIICQSISKIGGQVIEGSNHQIGGVYTSGGDISTAFLNEVGAIGIQIKDEVIPLAVYGKIMGGVIDSKPIITKGGLIGDDVTLSKCADYLLTKISSEFYKGE